MARKKDVIDPLLEEVLYELIAEKINAIPPAEAEETVKKLQAFLLLRNDCLPIFTIFSNIIYF